MSLTVPCKQQRSVHIQNLVSIAKLHWFHTKEAQHLQLGALALSLVVVS